MSKRGPVQPADWSVLAAVIVLAAPGALLLRRIVRSATSP
jgi:hypothetical protein